MNPLRQWSKMYPVGWFLAVFLAVSTSQLCCAGPLHAQCKVEWYAFIFVFIIIIIIIIINVFIYLFFYCSYDINVSYLF